MRMGVEMIRNHWFWHGVLRRCFFFLLVMFVLSIVLFFLARMAPGDPLQSFYGDALEMMSQAEQDAARERLGLDKGMFAQYAYWLLNSLQGDFGISFKYKMPVADVVFPLLGNTLLLGSLAYILVFAFAILLAVFCTLHEEDWLDKTICKVGTAAYYIPAFWLGVVLVLIFSDGFTI